MTTQITDHAAQAVALLPQHHRDKTNFPALTEAAATPVQPIEDALCQLLTERNVDTAIGAQLDVIGKLVGQPRSGLDDAEYRRLVRARISANRSRGTANDVLKTLRQLIYDANTSITINPEYPASFVVRLDGNDTDPVVAEFAADFLRDAASAGVRALLEYSESDPADTFVLGDAVDTEPGKGLGDLNTKSLNLVRASSQYAGIADNASLSITGAITVGAWVRFASMPTDVGPDAYKIITKWQTTGAQRSYQFYFTNVGGANTRLYLFWSPDGSAEAGANCDFVPVLNQWYHLVARFDPAAVGNNAVKGKIYINGVVQTMSGVNATQTSIFNGTADLRIGRDYSVTEYLDGMLDDVFVYSGVLSDAAIAKLAAGFPPADFTNYAGFWRLDDDYVDLSGNGNTLIPSGSPTFNTSVPFTGDENAGNFASVIEGGE